MQGIIGNYSDGRARVRTHISFNYHLDERSTRRNTFLLCAAAAVAAAATSRLCQFSCKTVIIYNHGCECIAHTHTHRTEHTLHPIRSSNSVACGHVHSSVCAVCVQLRAAENNNNLRNSASPSCELRKSEGNNNRPTTTTRNE